MLLPWIFLPFFALVSFLQTLRVMNLHPVKNLHLNTTLPVLFSPQMAKAATIPVNLRFSMS
jgi:hypothetical protein